MGREVRRVPADWQHPMQQDRPDRYQPMHDQPYESALREWVDEWQAWDRGERPSYCTDTDPATKYWDYAGGPPDPDYYRPDWPEESRTHFMMYEDTSEGTPISPAFATPEEVARWCADNGASAFGSETASYEAWLRIARGGYACSAVIENGVLRSGVEALKDSP